MRVGRLSVLVCMLVGLALPSAAWGQAQATTGVIQGVVADATGAVIVGAGVEVRNVDTNLVRNLSTDADGRFVSLQFPPGRYTVTVSKEGFSTIVQENLALTVGQTIALNLTMTVSPVAERVVVTETPTVDTVKTEVSSTLNQLTVSSTPVLGRKFEDLLTLTPGVSIVQGPDGDEISFAGQRGIFNNITLDGGDYNNGFFGEQMGGQRAAIDISMEAVQEFQVVATGGSAEFGRTASGIVNVVTKSGTNDVHGSLFHFQRLEALSANTSDGKPLKDFQREQFGGNVGGPIRQDKSFYFVNFEQIIENLTRDNLSVAIGTPCSISAPVFNVNITETQIAASPDCQRLALINFIRATRSGQEEGLPVEHSIRNTSIFGRFDWNLTEANQLSFSYSFDRSRNPNQTFDVATYGNSANGNEGPSIIQVLNFNLFSTVSQTKFNEAHFTYSREERPRSAVTSNVPADTAMGFVTSFRFGHPFFLNPDIDELFWRTHAKDNFSIVAGKHTIKFGGEWLHSVNDQVFRGFFEGRYIFDSVVGFLRYASPASLGAGFGPTVANCTGGGYGDIATPVQPANCPAGFAGGPLLFYLQDGIPSGLPGVLPPGASNIANEDYGAFIQDKWQVRPNFTLNYGLRWEAQILPDPVVPPAQTAYGVFLSDPRFPSDGTLHNQTREFQPRVGLAWDVRNNQKSVLRASGGIFYARQNMLTQVGSITTNGAQQRGAFRDTSLIGLLLSFGIPVSAVAPTWPDVLPPGPPSGCPGPPANPSPFECFTLVRVFKKDYHNPRVTTANVAYEQEIYPNWAVYTDFTWAKGVHLTRFINANFSGIFIPNLCCLMTAESSAKSLYRGWTIGVRKRFSQGFQLEGNYVLAKDQDDDSNERDPFTDRTFDHLDYSKDYSPSDRDIRHKVNFFMYGELPRGVQLNVRFQGRTAQPISPSPRTGRDRNSLRKDTKYFSLDWRVSRPFKIGERYAVTPVVEMFNSFNNKNNINPLIVPGLFDFNGFLRVGVGDPLQLQLAVKFTF